MGIWQDFNGTLGSFFRLGLTGVRLKDSSGNLIVRNPADSADAGITASQLINTGASFTVGTTNVLTLTRNASQSGALQVIFPSGKGTDSQALVQKAGTGAGIVEFEFASAGSTAQCLSVDVTALAFGASSPVTMFTLPANAIASMIEVIVDTAFNGTPSLSIGIAGTTSKYLAATQVDLKDVATTVFRVHPGVVASGSTEALIATYSAGGASAGAARINVYYGVPT